MAAKTLQIPRPLLEAVIAQCREEWPREACGIMTGSDGEVRRVFAMRNAHKHPTARYQIDPADQKVAMAGVLAGREELVAIYHSHPTTPAYPSQTDVSMAYYPEAIYMIISLAGEKPDVRSFRIQRGRVSAAAHRITARTGGQWLDLR